MFSGWSWWGSSTDKDKNAKPSRSSTELQAVSAAVHPAASSGGLVEHKEHHHGSSETVSAEAKAFLESQLNVWDNLRASVGRLEAQVRLKLETMLDPDIYDQVIRRGQRDENDRYVVVTKDKNDKVFYYQHFLNLLMDFQLVMVPASELHKAFTRLLENQGRWGKAKMLYGESGELNQAVNELGEFYNNFIKSMHELELDTALGRLPGFREVKAQLKLLAPVVTAKEQLSHNPFMESYDQNGDEWRQMLGLPPRGPAGAAESDDEEDDEEEDNEDLEEKRAAVEEKEADPAAQPSVSLGWTQAGARRALQNLPERMEAVKAALSKILADLTGSQVSPSVKKDIDKAIDATKKILIKLEKFTAQEQNWRSLLKFAYDIYPLVKDLLASLPQSYVSLNKILREHLLTTLRQFNYIIRDVVLFADRGESEFYLKDGSLLTLAEGKQDCGLYQMQARPTAKTKEGQALLDKILGDSQDAYILNGRSLYYVHRYTNKQSKVPGIKVKPLRFRAFENRVDQNGVPLLYGFPGLHYDLGVTDGVMLPEGYRRIHQRLSPLQLRKIYAMMQLEGIPSGRYRDRDFYEDGLNLSLAHFAEEFNAWAENLGYQFKPEERYPYTRAMLAQRQELLDEEKEVAGLEEKRGASRAPYKAVLLEKRQAAKIRQLAEEEAVSERNSRRQAEELSRYKYSLIRLQIEARIAELKKEIDSRWLGIAFTDKKEQKMALLEILKRQFEKRPLWNCQKILRQLELEKVDISLLKEGRTGKLLHTLTLATSTPADRIPLIDAELAKLRQEQRDARNYWFFAERRRNQLANRVLALSLLKESLKPGYRVQEILDNLSAKKPEQFAVLQQEKALLKQLKEIDQFMPDSVLGKRLVDFSDSMFNKIERDHQAVKEAIKAGRRPAPSIPHFFRPASLALPSAAVVRDEKQADAQPRVPATPVAGPKKA